jgi:hypothetical protein
MLEYTVKVRGTADKPMYLWGSDGISVSLQWPLLLTVRNDVLGEPITIGTLKIIAEGEVGPKTIGTLRPGESYTIPLVGLIGVLAFCTPDPNAPPPGPNTQPIDSSVQCMLIVPQLAGPNI